MTPRRALFAVVGTIVALNVVLFFVTRLTESPSGPRSSSYATSPAGLAAYADLVREHGHPITRLRERPRDADLDARTVVVLLDPDTVTREDVDALAAFVRDGGTLVAGGAQARRWYGALLDRPPQWTSDGVEAASVIAPVPETAGVRRVTSAGGGAWEDAGETLPAIGRGERALLTVTQLGRGRVSLLADPSPLQNRHLARADNAALGLALAGPRSRRVVFVESVHGYGAASGVAAIPTQWRWAFALLGLAALCYVLARLRRLGPPERASRELPPPRRLFVESLAAVMQRTRDPVAAVAPLRSAARDLLVARTGGRVDDDSRLRELAPRLGLTDVETDAILAPAGEHVDVLATGRAFAKLQRSSLRAS